VWNKCLAVYRKLGGRETVAYAIVGLLTTALAFGVFQLCFFAGLRSAAIANTVASALAILFAYFANKVWVFRSKSFALALVSREMAAFFAGRAFTWFVETALLALLVDLAALNETYCKLGASVLVIVLNYFISKKAVFKQ
jgi:putative flippase GtrA